MGVRIEKLIKRKIEAFEPGGEVYDVNDTELRGFMLRVFPSGRKAFYLYYRNAQGIRRRPRLGDYHPETFSAERARTKAIQWLGRVASGEDPSAEQQELRHAETFGEFASQYLNDVTVVRRLKPNSLEDYRRQLRLHLMPVWGDKKLVSIRQVDVTNLHRRLAQPRKVTIQARNSDKSYCREQGGPVGANRVLSLIKLVFNEAERLGLIPVGTNPARYVKPYKESHRERYLTAEELARLTDVIEALEAGEKVSPHAAAAIRLLLLTGARREEILSLQWRYVDLEAKCLRLPDSKTGAKVIHLNSPAVAILKRLWAMREAGSPWVICGHKRGSRLVNLTKPWDRIRSLAGFSELRIHDLRHIFAGTGAGLGLGLVAVGKLLGHSQPSTTARYANLAPDPIQAASEAIGVALLDAIEKGKARNRERNQLQPVNSSGIEAGANVVDLGEGSAKPVAEDTSDEPVVNI